VYKINDTVFIGANGWYDWKIMEPAYSQKQSYYYWTQWMNDSRCIIYDKDAYDKFYAGPAQLAKKQANRLAKMVEKYQDDETINNIVVVTHTAPLVQLLTIKNDIHWDGLTASFGNSQMKKVLQKDI